jgi:hypothetical protein
MTKRSILLAAVSSLCMPARAHAIAGVVDNLDNVPEALHAEYVQQGDKFVLQVTGMKPQAEFDTLQRTHSTVKTELTGLKQRITQHFGERKFEDVVVDLDKIEEYKAAADGKLDDEKINGIVEGRVRTRLAPVERERDGYKTRVGELEGTVGELTSKEKKRLIKDKAREAAAAAKVKPEAIDDFLLLAETVFEVREDDNEVVVKEGTAYTAGVQPSVLLTDLQAKRPHWWGESVGGGAGGNRGGPGATTNPFTLAGWNMTAQGQLMASDPAKAEQLAKAAGHVDAATARKPAK